MKSMNLFGNNTPKEDIKPKKKEYSKEFKELAVNLASKIGVTKAAEELGVSTNLIYSWKKTLNTSTLAKNSLAKKLPPAPIQDENGNITFELEGKTYSLNVNSEEERKRVKEEVNTDVLDKYDWFKEDSGENHWVFYNTEMYEIVNDKWNGQFLHYMEDCDLTPIMPINTTSCYMMFSECKSLTQLDLSNFDTRQVTTMINMFCRCYRLTQLDLSSFDTHNVTRMNGMFSCCESLNQLDLNNFDTSKVTDMQAMFYYCKNLTSLDISNFDTSRVTGMNYMFLGCELLIQLDLNNFNTSKVINMYSMFSKCSKLTSLDLSNFDTKRVTNVGQMFYGCSALTNLDLSNFDTSKVTEMYSMFSGCKSLTQLDLSNFDTSQVTDIRSMFAACEKLTTIYISDKWKTNSIVYSGNMFNGCCSLTGFSQEKTNVKMAKPVEQSGYLTLKSNML